MELLDILAALGAYHRGDPSPLFELRGSEGGGARREGIDSPGAPPPYGSGMPLPGSPPPAGPGSRSGYPGLDVFQQRFGDRARATWDELGGLDQDLHKRYDSPEAAPQAGNTPRGVGAGVDPITGGYAPDPNSPSLFDELSGLGGYVGPHSKLMRSKPSDLAPEGSQLKADLKALEEATQAPLNSLNSLYEKGKSYITGGSPSDIAGAGGAPGAPGAEAPPDFWHALGAMGEKAKGSGGSGAGGGAGGGDGGGVYKVPLGDPYPDLGPLPTHQVAPGVDFSHSNTLFEQSAPTREPSDEFGTILAGLSGLMDDHSRNVGEFLLHAGSALAGSVGGLRREERAAENDFMKRTQSFHAAEAEHALSQAGVEQQHAQTVADTEYQNKVAQREEDWKKWEAAQPKVLSAAGGVLAYEATGPDGKKYFAMDTRPALELTRARSIARGLDPYGLGTSMGDTFPYGATEPGEYAAWAAGELMDEPGYAEQVLGNDWMKIAQQSAAQAQLTNVSPTNKKAMHDQISILHTQLSAYLMAHPDKLQAIIRTRVGQPGGGGQ